MLTFFLLLFFFMKKRFGMQKSIMPVKSNQCSVFLTGDTVFCQVTRLSHSLIPYNGASSQTQVNTQLKSIIIAVNINFYQDEGSSLGYCDIYILN